ncbi:MAG: hypothetical protein IK088_02165, partial [Lachnospiraceae bacterium]|nr:hypothetical protein [Lachnospiraceae bacterium]
KMMIRKYGPDTIFEFDTLDELRIFDPCYVDDTRSVLIKQCAKELGVPESEIVQIRALKNGEGVTSGFSFVCRETAYRFLYQEGNICRLS